MLVALAFCPHPVMLVPQVSRVAEESLADLRSACDAAVAGMLDPAPARAPDRVLVVGGGSRAESYRSGDWGSLRGYGVPVSAVLGAGACSGRGGMPLSITLGAWLLRRASYSGDVQGFGVPDGASGTQIDEWAREIAGLGGTTGPAAPAERIGLLVMGDGSARRDASAPGYVDERARTFDDRVAAALRMADARTLAALDPDEGRTLMAAGTQAWRLAGRVAEAEQQPPDRQSWQARLLYEQAPYGVGYHVALWTARTRPREAASRGSAQITQDPVQAPAQVRT